MSRSPGLGLDLTPFLNAGTNIAASVAAAEQARQNAKAAAAASRAPVVQQTVSRGIPPIVIAGGIGVLVLGAWFVFGRRKGRGRR